MTQREQIEALKAEVSELREKIASLTEAMLQLAVKQPTEVPYVVTPYAPYTPPTWPQVFPYSQGPLWVTTTGSSTGISQGDGVVWNSASSGDITGD